MSTDRKHPEMNEDVNAIIVVLDPLVSQEHFDEIRHQIARIPGVRGVADGNVDMDALDHHLSHHSDQ